MAQIHVPSLAPEIVGHIGTFAITNTMINAWVAIVFFLIFGLVIRKKLTLRPGRLQNFCEYVLELIMGYFDQVTGSRPKTIRFLPIVGSVFFFILFSNWLGLLPGTGTISWGHSALLRPATTDLNLTIAMAVAAVAASHLFGLLTVGVFAHLNKFVQIGTIVKSLRRGPLAIFTAIIEFGVGLIEIISEFAKVMSLSLRLFGNIFAGEVLLAVMAGLVSILIPTPFMFLELLVGIVQAGVFAMLTLVYMTVATAQPHGSEEH